MMASPARASGYSPSMSRGMNSRTLTSGQRPADIETVPVEITNGNLEITFTPNIENPQINGIEIIPAN